MQQSSWCYAVARVAADCETGTWIAGGLVTVGADGLALPVTDYLPLEWFVELAASNADTAYVRVVPTYETDWLRNHFPSNRRPRL